MSLKRKYLLMGVGMSIHRQYCTLLTTLDNY